MSNKVTPPTAPMMIHLRSKESSLSTGDGVWFAWGCVVVAAVGRGVTTAVGAELTGLTVGENVSPSTVGDLVDGDIVGNEMVGAFVRGKVGGSVTAT